jgi:hypothetical protein
VKPNFAMRGWPTAENSSALIQSTPAPFLHGIPSASAQSTPPPVARLSSPGQSLRCTHERAHLVSANVLHALQPVRQPCAFARRVAPACRR